MSSCVKKPQLVVPVFGWSKVAMRCVSCRTSFFYHFYDFIFVRLSWLSVQLLFLPTSHCRQCHMPLVGCPRSVKHKYKIENINGNPKIQTTNPKTQIQIQNRKHKWKSQNTNTNPKTQIQIPKHKWKTQVLGCSFFLREPERPMPGMHMMVSTWRKIIYSWLFYTAWKLTKTTCSVVTVVNLLTKNTNFMCSVTAIFALKRQWRSMDSFHGSWGNWKPDVGTP